MLVSHSHRFVYLKTHKAAGSSIYRMLARFCAPPEFLASPACETCAVHLSGHGIVARLVDNVTQNYRPHRLEDHSPLALLQDMLPTEFHRYHKIAAVRHPYDKVVSAFFFFLWNQHQRNAANPLPQSLARAELVKRFCAFAIPQPRVVTGRHDREYFFCADRFCIDSVIRYEHLHEDLQAVNERLGLGLDVRAALPHEKRRRQDRAGLAYRDLIAPAAKAAIDAHYDWYFERFGYDRVFPDESPDESPEESSGANPSSSAQPRLRAR